MPIVHVKCRNGHELALEVARPKGFAKLCKQGKRVCPECKPENVELIVFDPDKDRAKCVHDKDYVCKHGHITSFAPFTNGMINVSWGKDFENIEGVPADVAEWIESGSQKCRHYVITAKGGKRRCNCKLKPIDDSVLAYPNVVGIKTRVRVGDIWDKEKCPEPKETHVETFRQYGEEDARVVTTEFSERNKRRLRKLRKDRQTKPQGEVLRTPSDRTGDKLTKDQAMRGARNEYD